MTPPGNQNARQVALSVLNAFDEKKGDAANILHTVIERTEQKAQATDIVFGVIRNRIAIDMVITKIAETPVKRIKKKLLNILRIGAYELIYAIRTAEYAIVNDAVQLAHDLAGKKQAGFVNALLRNITRGIAERVSPLTDDNATRTLPQSAQSGCRFNMPILPNPKTSPAEYLHNAFSLPRWLISEWTDEFDYDKTLKVCFASNRRPSVFLWPNTLKTTAEELLEKLNVGGTENGELIVPESRRSAPMIRLKGRRNVTELSGFDEGLFIVQDPTAGSVISMLAPESGQIVIDLCAAPGTKTVRMALAMEDRGKIFASDIDDDRLKKVDQNCARLGITIVKAIKYSQFSNSISDFLPADTVLLDVPCSNTGVLSRRPEVRLRLKQKDIVSLAKTQLKLLNTAAEFLKPGGIICYSTCSIQRKENCMNIEKFLTQNPDFELKFQKLTLPSTDDDARYDYDGGYVAVMAKKLTENTSF